MKTGHATTRGWPRRVPAALAFALLVLLLLPRAAFAHGEVSEDPMAGGTTEPVHEGAAKELEVPLIRLRVPKEATLGGHVTLRATLTDPHDGEPIRGALVTFEAPAFWGEEFQGMMVIGSARTDRMGVATLTTQMRSSGDLEIRAVFEGVDGFAPVSASADLDVRGDVQLYESKAGIRVPWLNLWVLAAVIGLVWSLYFLVGLRVLAIARPRTARAATTEPAPAASAAPVGVGATSRREFLGHVLPLGAQAGIAAIGVGLVTVVARSPRTHGNLMAPPSTVDYRRTPVARVGRRVEMREMPEPLDREVSFSKEVLPIFLANGGPHVVRPRHSPPPGALMLDSYEHVMAKEGVVVPGKPEDSELVMHLLTPGIQMPPSMPPLPEEQIQLIVSWIAQGAKDT